MTVISAIYLAWLETLARYRKSVLGPFWMTLANVIGVVGLGAVWSAILKKPAENFIPALTVGLIVWQFVAGVIGEAPRIFVMYGVSVRNIPTPLNLFVFRGLVRHIINYFHNIIIIICVFLFFKIHVDFGIIMSIVGFLLVVANLFWISYFLGALGARYRDIDYLVNSFMPLLFFLSPVLFRSSDFSIDANIIFFNPVSHMIDVIRAPLFGEMKSDSYVFMSISFVVGISLYLVFRRFIEKHIAFWV